MLFAIHSPAPQYPKLGNLPAGNIALGQKMLSLPKVNNRRTMRSFAGAAAIAYLILGALVLGSLAIGYLALSASCINCGGDNVETVTLASAYLHSGTTASSSGPASAYLALSINNPGSTTYITFIALSSDSSLPTLGGPGPNTTDVSLGVRTNTSSSSVLNRTTAVTTSSPAIEISNWQSERSSAQIINFSQISSTNLLASGKVSSFAFYPWTQTPISIVNGSTYNYVIDFSNGQSISGSLIAQ